MALCDPSAMGPCGCQLVTSSAGQHFNVRRKQDEQFTFITALNIKAGLKTTTWQRGIKLEKFEACFEVRKVTPGSDTGQCFSLYTKQKCA